MSRLEFKSNGNSMEYKVKVVCDSMIYVKKLEGHLLSLNYLVSWKNHPKKENIGKPTLVVLHLCKYIIIFYCDYSEKPIATLPLIDFAPLMVRPTIKPRAETSSIK